MKINDIIRNYQAGELTVEQANDELRKINAGFTLNPDKNVIGENENNSAVVDIAQYSGVGMMDSGTGTLDKVQIVRGKLKDSVGKMFVIVDVGGKKYHVKDDGVTLYDAE